MIISGKKIRTLRALKKIAYQARRAGKIVVTTNGCFDILHPGHVANLEWAKSRGDMLVVGVNSDASVRANKGPYRPIVPARDRARVIASLGAVDYVFIFGDNDPLKWLETIKPSLHVKGRGSKQEFQATLSLMQSVLKKNKGRLIFFPHLGQYSTTSIVKAITRLIKKGSK